MLKCQLKKLQTITHFNFSVYLQITFEKHSILYSLDRKGPLNRHFQFFCKTQFITYLHTINK